MYSMYVWEYKPTNTYKLWIPMHKYEWDFPCSFL